MRIPRLIMGAMLELPKKTRRAFNIPGHAHYLTFSCYHGYALLSKDTTRRWLIEAVQEARWRHEMDVHAYVIMPEHVHLLVRPRQTVYRMADFLQAVKRPVSWKAKQFLVESGDREWLARLTVKKGTRGVFRFWEAGGGSITTSRASKRFSPSPITFTATPCEETWLPYRRIGNGPAHGSGQAWTPSWRWIPFPHSKSPGALWHGGLVPPWWQWGAILHGRASQPWHVREKCTPEQAGRATFARNSRPRSPRPGKPAVPRS